MSGIIIPGLILSGAIPEEVSPQGFDYPASGLVARWEGAEGQTLLTQEDPPYGDIGDLQSWTDQTGGLSLPYGDVEYPTIVPAQSGEDAIRVGSSASMTLSGIGSLPSGSAARTVALCFKPEVDEGAFGGFAWGTNANNQSFGVVVNTDNTIQADFFNNSLAGPTANGGWYIIIATYDGTTVRLYSNNVLIDSVAVVLNTGTTQINLCESFSGNTTIATVGAVFVYDNVLSDADRGTLNTYLSDKYINDTAAPVFSGLTLRDPTSVSLELALTSDETANAWCVLTTSSTVPSDTQILNGQDHTGAAAAGSFASSAVTLNEFTHVFSGLSSSTTYYAHGYADDGSSNRLNFSTTGVATSAPDTTAPVLSSGSVNKSGSSGYSGSVTTANDDNGTLYHVVTTRNTVPTAAQVKTADDDQGNDAAASGNQVITSTGAKAFGGGGLTAETTYYSYAMHEDAAGNQSNVLALGSFTTDAAATGSFPAADVTVSSIAALTSQLDTWDGQTLTEDKYLDLATGSYGTISMSDYDFSPFRVYIRGVDKSTPNTQVSAIQFDNCKNITAQFFKTDRTNAGHSRHFAYFSNLTSNCAVEYCDFQGDPNSGADVSQKSLYALRETNGCSFNAIRHCLIRYHVVGLYTQGDNWTVEFNQFHGIHSDDVKIGDGFGGTFNRNWFSKNKSSALTGINDHIDWLQGLGNSGQTDLTCVGNAGIKGPITTGGVSGKAQQGLFVDDGQMTRVSMTQNIMITNNGGCKFGSDVSAAGGSGNEVSRNTCIFPSDDPTGGYTCSANVVYGSGDYNLTVVSDSAGILGANSQAIRVGTNKSNADYSEYTDWLEGGVIVNGATIGDVMPKVGSGAHWNDADPVGAAERFREISVDGNHPGNSPNATLAAFWQSTYNSDNAVTS